MNIWALADLHLNISIPEKTMEVFHICWENYVEKIKKNWTRLVQKEDIVLLAGDFCWAMHLSDALKDLMWLEDLPGIKYLIKGNHDYWWSSLSKMKKLPLKTIHFIHNNAEHVQDIAIAGSRLWDSSEYSFHELIEFKENPLENKKEIQKELNEKIFEKELQRLELSLSKMDPKAKLKIAMTHYPPISWDLMSSKASKILEKYHVDICIFGHLHSIKKRNLFGKKNNILYVLTSCDYLDFTPICLKQASEKLSDPDLLN